MNRESTSGSKCSKLEGEQRKSHRTCIAVGTEEMVQKTVDAEISPAAQLCEEIKETARSGG